jgi:hypothetical protein
MVVGIMAIAGLNGVHLAALSPSQLRMAMDAATDSEPDSVILEVSIASSWDEPIVEVEIDNGWELYVASGTGEILGRERDVTSREDRQIAAAVRAGELVSLDAAWERILMQLEQSERHNWLGAGDVHTIEYDVEFRRPVVEVQFRPSSIRAERASFGDRDERDDRRARINVYADAATGDILSVEYDD